MARAAGGEAGGLEDVEVAVDDVDSETEDGEDDESLVQWDVGDFLQVGNVFDV